MLQLPSGRRGAPRAAATARRRLAVVVAGIVAAAVVAPTATAAPAATVAPAGRGHRAAAAADLPDPAALPALPADSTYARQILMALDPAHAEPTRARVVSLADQLGQPQAATGPITGQLRYYSQPHIRDLFQQYLDRPADASGLRYWSQQVYLGHSFELVATSLASSSEAERHAGTTTASYVAWAYQHVLGRAADAGGKAYWIRRLDAGTSHAKMVGTLLRSSDRATKLVDAAYLRYLGRPADRGGRASLVRQYTSRSIGEIQVIAHLLGSDEARGSGCDSFDTRLCILPFPNDEFTVPDPTTATGRRVAFKPEWLPANEQGKHPDPTEWNRNDGFSVGQAAIVQIPGLDLAETGAAPLTDIGASLDADAPIAVIDADTGERQPIFTELDSQVTGAATTHDQVLYIRPAVDYTAGHRYIVAIRHPKDAAGHVIPTPASFAQYSQDAGTTGIPKVEARRPHMDELFSELSSAGIAKADLYLAWDFTVASTANTTGRMLSIRDRALASLHGHAPAFTVTKVTANPATGVAKRIEGTYSVPLYLTGDGSAGHGFATGSDGLPVRNGTYQAAFDCEIPSAASTTPARPVVYGHGLFGDLTEVQSGPQRAMTAGYDMAYCATNWIGMSDQDVGNAVNIIHDISTFNTLADRSQQGILDTIFLGRLLTTADGFVSNAAFQTGAHAPLIDTSHLFYDGNSQGAVIGGAYLAVSPDTEAGVLGVAGMNYSTLLERSVDFDPFRTIMAATYTDPVVRSVGLGLLQMLWDRGETDGYAAHIVHDPLEGTPAKRLLVHVAVGDHQVSTVTAEIEARTAGIAVSWPPYADGRSPDIAPSWNLPAITYPSTGSGLVIWDSGSPLAPIGNLPPRAGHDPHEDPRNSPDAQSQKDQFLTHDGQIVDVCGGQACTAPQS